MGILFLVSCYKDNCMQSVDIIPLFNEINKNVYLEANDTAQNHIIINNIRREINKNGFITVYKRGVIINKAMFNNNQNTGSCFYYWSNGSIQTYNSNDFQGNTRYIRDYMNDSVYTHQGTILGQLMWDGTLDSLQVKDTVVVHLAYAIPSHCAFYILIKDSLQNSNSKNCDDYLPINGITGIATIKKKYNTSGSYTRKVYAILKDSLSHKMEYDTLSAQFILR